MMLENHCSPLHHFLTPTLANSLTLIRPFSAGDHVSLWTRHPSLGQRLMTGSSLDHFQHTNTQTLILRIKFCLSVWHPHLLLVSICMFSLQTFCSPHKLKLTHRLFSSSLLHSSFFPSSPPFLYHLASKALFSEVDHLIGRPILHFDIIGLG